MIEVGHNSLDFLTNQPVEGELLADLLNALNDSAEEGVATDNLFSSSFGQPTVFLDPRRAMLGLKN